jgi:hypothetical protein
MAPDAVPTPAPAPAPARAGLRKIAPYWYPYTTMAKGRWLNREILEIVSTEFRDRSIEYYVWFFFFFLVLFAFSFCWMLLSDGGEGVVIFVCCVEIRARVWRDYYQRQDRQAWYDRAERGSHRKCRSSSRAPGDV